MNALELKVPPPVVALALALAMWAVSRLTLTFEVAAPLRIAVAVAIALVGGVFSAAGITAFRRAKTTVNPMKPETRRAPPGHGRRTHSGGLELGLPRPLASPVAGTTRTRPSRRPKACRASNLHEGCRARPGKTTEQSVSQPLLPLQAWRLAASSASSSTFLGHLARSVHGRPRQADLERW